MNNIKIFVLAILLFCGCFNQQKIVAKPTTIDLSSAKDTCINYCPSTVLLPYGGRLSIATLPSSAIEVKLYAPTKSDWYIPHNSADAITKIGYDSRCPAYIVYEDWTTNFDEYGFFNLKKLKSDSVATQTLSYKNTPKIIIGAQIITDLKGYLKTAEVDTVGDYYGIMLRAKSNKKTIGMFYFDLEFTKEKTCLKLVNFDDTNFGTK